MFRALFLKKHFLKKSFKKQNILYILQYTRVQAGHLYSLHAPKTFTCAIHVARPSRPVAASAETYLTHEIRAENGGSCIPPTRREPGITHYTSPTPFPRKHPTTPPIDTESSFHAHESIGMATPHPPPTIHNRLGHVPSSPRHPIDTTPAATPPSTRNAHHPAPSRPGRMLASVP